MTIEERDTIIKELKAWWSLHPKNPPQALVITALRTILDEMVDKEQFKHGQGVLFFVGKTPMLVRLGWNCARGEKIAADLLILCRNRVNELREAEHKSWKLGDGTPM